MTMATDGVQYVRIQRREKYMHTKERTEELAWLYLLYTEAVQIPLRELPSYLKQLRSEVNVQELEETYSLKRGSIVAFYKDLMLVLRHIAHNDHKLRGLRLRAAQRNKIAYVFAIIVTSKKFWWLGDLHEGQIQEFSFTHAITHDESKAFMKLLQKEVRALCSLEELNSKAALIK